MDWKIQVNRWALDMELWSKLQTIIAENSLGSDKERNYLLNIDILFKLC